MRPFAALRAIPTLLRIGFSEAVAYRAEMLVWVFATTMPLIMMMLWTTVAEVAPVMGQGGRAWGSGAFVAYFLSVFIVRQLISAWAAWEINFEVRQGLLSMRLLRPMHPVLSYAMSNLAYMPMRALVTLPVLAILLVTELSRMTADWRVWLLWPLAMVGGWLITFFANVAIGSLSFFIDSSIKIMDVWLAAFFVFSGYLFPLELFPEWLRVAAQWMPFRYQIGLPVELMTGQLTVEAALPLLARQYAWAAVMIALSLTLWRGGIKRFQAFGG
ncbi:MAG: ABC-2 family transporter protein [Archangium sp.]|nr:ABC-2 family transporter protein [Archangium sp.]